MEGAAARLPHPHPLPHHVPSHAPKPTAETADVAARAASLTIAEAQGERQAEQHLRGVQSTLMKPVMFEFFGMMATPVLWAANKLNLTRVNTAIRSVLRAPALALRDIKTKDAFQLPAAFMGQVANQATEARATGWASSAAATSERLASKGEVWQQGFSKLVDGIKRSNVAEATPAFLKTALTKVGNAPLFATLMVTGVVAGFGATLLGARAESKESKAAFKQLMADLGGKVDTGFAKSLKVAKAAKDKTALAKLGLETVGAAADGFLWAKSNVGMGAMAFIAIPQICTMLVPDSPLLGAYAALKKADAGELQLQGDKRAEMVRQLVAVVPSVAAHGGVYNRLGGAVAQEIVARQMTTQQTLQLLNDDKAFTAFAEQVNAKMAAAAPKVGTVAPANAKAANEATMSKAEHAYHAAEKPGMIAAGGEHRGTVAHAPQRKMA